MSETLHAHPENESQPQEVERKFTVLEIPANLHEFESKQIRQGYIAIGADGTEVRIRDSNGTFTQTIKSKGGLVRGEWEEPLSQQQFNTFWPTTEGKRVEKTRYSIPLEELVIELDIYEGSLAGLVTAEVEFPSTDAANRFEPPHWFAEDVTAVSNFKNQNLAVFGFPTDA